MYGRNSHAETLAQHVQTAANNSDRNEEYNMIKSMTGFGRCEIQKDAKKFTVELKSVNHRYLDVNIRMPKKLNFFETAIRNPDTSEVLCQQRQSGHFHYI